MATYTVTGEMQLGRRAQPFTREVEASSEKHARETALSQLTSEHSMSRANVTISDIEAN